MAENRLTIIAVDDEEMNLLLLEELARQIGLEIVSFSDPLEALEYVKNNNVDLMLVDYMMPVMDGLHLIKESLSVNRNILALMITAVSDNEEVKLDALKAGATDFLGKPLHAAEFQTRIQNLAKLKTSQLAMVDFNQRLMDEVQEATSTLIEREHETLRVLSKAAEYKDPETASHIARVAHYSKMLARELGLDNQEQDILFYASPLHDIGKVGVNDSILLKQGRLEHDEFETMKRHCVIGHDILSGSENPYLKAGAVIAAAHHEKYDGSGYPRGLSGEEIHIYGRITAIADVFDALTSVRPYKEAWTFEDAAALIERESGRHFDPKMVELFLKNIDEVRTIYEKFKEYGESCMFIQTPKRPH